jgi:hypothetical protein
MMQKSQQQRLFWSVSRPLKYLGLTLDEWAIALIGVLPGVYFINSANIRVGGSFLIGGLVLCWSFKKYKRLAQSFKIKSFLIAKNLFKAPSKYPKMLNKSKVGR